MCARLQAGVLAFKGRGSLEARAAAIPQLGFDPKTTASTLCQVESWTSVLELADCQLPQQLCKSRAVADRSLSNAFVAAQVGVGIKKHICSDTCQSLYAACSQVRPLHPSWSDT